MPLTVVVSTPRHTVSISAMIGPRRTNSSQRSDFEIGEGLEVPRDILSGMRHVTPSNRRCDALVWIEGKSSKALPDLLPGATVCRRAVTRPSRGDDIELDHARAVVERSCAAIAQLFADVRIGHPVRIGDVEPVVDEIAASLARDPRAIILIVRSKDRNEYTVLHSITVCALMVNLARQLGQSEFEVRQAGMGGMLYDIGKSNTPVEILEKPSRLNEQERRVIEYHPRGRPSPTFKKSGC